MLGWLILFSFLTGAFVGSTALLGAMIFLSKDPATKRNLDAHDDAVMDRGNTPTHGPILT